MKTPHFHAGSILLEILVVVALSSMIFVGLAGLLATANLSSGRALDEQRALWIAQEGLDALKTLSFEDLTITDVGALSFVAPEWQLTFTGPQVIDHFSRTVFIEEVERDTDCFIVESGGTTDPDSLNLVSEVTWTNIGGKSRSITLESLRTRWDDPQGDCFKPTMAGRISLDTSLANWGGAKQLRDVFVINDSDQEAVITEIIVTWDEPSSLLQQAFIGDNKVWSDVGPGTPAGTQPSGTLIDIQNETIAAFEDGEAYKIQFTKQMAGSTLTITFNFSDGSTLTTDPFIPGP